MVMNIQSRSSVEELYVNGYFNVPQTIGDAYFLINEGI